MTEQHRHHLGPAAKPPSMVLCSMPAYRLFKLGPRKYPQNLRKNTAYSTHGGKLLLIEIGFPGRNPNLNLAGFPPPLKKANLDKTDFQTSLRDLMQSSRADSLALALFPL